MKMPFLRSSCNMNGGNIWKDNIMHDLFILFFQSCLRITYNNSYYGRARIILLGWNRGHVSFAPSKYNSPSLIRNKPAVMQQIVRIRMYSND